MFIQKTVQTLTRRRFVSSISVFCISLMCTGCFFPEENEEEITPPPPVAGVRLIHQDPMRGPVDLYAGSQFLTTVSYGQVSEAIELELGDQSFSMKQNGAPTSFYDSELIGLEEQLYHFVLVGDQLGGDPVLELTQAPPAPVEDQHWVRVLDLSDIEEGVMIRGNEVLATLPLSGDNGNPSAFKATSAASSTTVSISVILEDMNVPIPKKIREGVSLPAGGASLVIVTGSVEEDTIDMAFVALDLERTPLLAPEMPAP